jgi:hypothetical protein
MAKRSLLPAVAAIVIALLVGWAVSARAQTTYTATCIFRVGWYPQAIGNIDNAVTSQGLASQAVQSVQTTGEVFGIAAQGSGVGAAQIQAETSISQSGDGGFFSARVTDAQAARATQLADRVCQAVVTAVTDQQTRSQEAQAAAVTQQILQLEKDAAALQAVPPQSRTPEQAIRLAADQAAIARDQQYLPVVLSTAPLQAEVLRPAYGAVANDNANLSRNLIIAGVSGLLVAFLIVLISEIVSDATGRPRLPVDGDGVRPSLREAGVSGRPEPVVPAARPSGRD